ncbi:MAG: phytanoyl-CoA dioxygenase family protein [Planctomycetota bacterium]|nr:phytanoyl-CoA dioxygenase family protein [Planctomycetota bacterium]
MDGQPVGSRKEAYDRDGFVIVREFLVGKELTTLQSQLDRYIRDVVPTLSSSSAFFHDRSRPETLKQLQHMGCDAFFNEYRAHPRWCELATELIGETSEAQEPEWFSKPPGTVHVTPPHQDNFYFCLRPPHAATLWLALDPVDEENGCLRYVRQSHRKGIRSHNATQVLGFSQGIFEYSEADQGNEVEVTLQPGDLAIHHCETIHRADANQSLVRQRRAFAMVFRGQSCQRDETAFDRYQTSVKAQHQELGLDAS